MKRVTPLLAVLPLILAACGVNVREIQQIEISAYPDNESNVWLAKGLIYYDPRVLVELIPSLNEENFRGLNLGWFIQDSNKTPYYRITYNMKDPKVASNIRELKADFEKNIPELAEKCALPKSKIQDLEAISDQWWKHFSEGDFETCWNQFENSDPNLNYDTFVENFGTLLDQFGEMKNKDLFYVHPYDQIDGHQNVYSLVYEVEFSDIAYANIRTVIAYEDPNNWKVIGFACQGRKNN